jgi:hypothetical protein
MTKKTLLDFRVYGFFEFILMLMFSILLISVPALRLGRTYAAIISFILLLVALLTSIYMLFFKSKARAYLYVMVVRWSLFTMVPILANFQSGVNSELDITEICWLVGSIMVAVVTVIIAFHYANRRWNELVADSWIKNKKIDIDNARFSIMAPGDVPEKKKESKSLPNIFLICFAGFLIMKILSNLGGDGFNNFMDRLVPLVLVVASSFILATYLCRATNISKIERKMKLKFLTEYANSEELVQLSRKKW